MDTQGPDGQKWLQPPRIQILTAAFCIAGVVVNLAAQDWFDAAVAAIFAVFMVWVAYLKRDGEFHTEWPTE